MRISNRLLWLFIIVVFVFFIFLFWIFLKKNAVFLEINSNENNFSWKIYNIKFSKDFFCKQKKCIISNVPPFEYNLTLTKTGFLDIHKKINLSKSIKLDIKFQKKIKLKKIENKITRKQLINKIIQDKKNNFYYLWKKLQFRSIINSKNYLYAFYNKKLIFYNKNNNYSFDIDFYLNIEYIKELYPDLFVIKTNKWAFNFNKKTKEIDYFSLFDDYVYFNNFYIGVIDDNDLQRKNNLWFKNKKWNLVILYDLKTKTKRILYISDYKIKKIFIESNKVFIENSKNQKYEIVL